MCIYIYSSLAKVDYINIYYKIDISDAITNGFILKITKEISQVMVTDPHEHEWLVEYSRNSS